jgi:xanthine dehydrogenase accessory factor
MHNFFSTAADLKAKGEPFAAVTVVHSEAPSSGKTGDKALFGNTGLLEGWIGGGCVYSIVLKEVQAALQDGKPRLVQVSPDPAAATQPGIKSYKMTCHSGGSVNLYIEPVMPRPHIIVLGKSVIGRALLKMAKAADYRLTVINDAATAQNFPEAGQWYTHLKDLAGVGIDAHTFIVVATQGDQDEAALEAALSVTARYTGFVGSRKKWGQLCAALMQKGHSEDQLKAIRAPVGLDINGKTPEEVAISILAEIIQEYRTIDVSNMQFSETPPEKEAPQAAPADNRPQVITNPVCGMPISLGMAKHIVAYNEELIYFCCDGCKTSFDRDPDVYMNPDRAEEKSRAPVHG